jgi:hypothetical protein
VLEIAASFLEKTFDSQNFPLKVALPPGAIPGGDVGELQYKHGVGFTRVLAAMLLLEGVDSRSCFWRVWSLYKAFESEDKAGEASLRLKFQVSESVRPSVFQIYHNLRKRVERQGLDFNVVCQDAVKAFNSETKTLKAIAFWTWSREWS